MRKTYRKQLGVTLLELIVSLALIGIIVLVIYSMNTFGSKTFAKGQNKSNVQFDARMTLENITNEVRYASKVVLLPDNSTIPATVTNNDCYIYTESSGTSKVIKYKDNTGTKNIATFDSADLTFTTNVNRGLCYNLVCTDKGESFTINSEVLPLNMTQGTDITGSGSAAIQFTKYETVAANGLTFGPYPHNGYADRDYLPVVNFNATGGTAPYTFSNPSANLPSGMNLSSDGRLSGHPTVAGNFVFDVKVTDSSTPSKTNTRSFVILIGDPGLTAAAVASGIGSTYLVPDVLSNTAILTLPTVPFGFAVYISNTSDASIIRNDGTITHPTLAPTPVPPSPTPVPVSVNVTFEVINQLDQYDAPGHNTISIIVPPGVSDSAPVASNVAITGIPKINSTLVPSYLYNDSEHDLEGTSIIKWYRSDSPTGTKILLATAASYTTSSSDLNKYIFCEVTPIATSGTLTGSPVMSSGTKILLGDTPSVDIIGIKLNGTMVTEAPVGSLLTFDYQYIDLEGDHESGTTIIWYRANGNNSTQVGTGLTYTTIADDKNKKIYVEITPRASSGASPGSTVTSLEIKITN